MTWIAPLLAGVALAATVLILVWDLEHPQRFHYVLTKPQGRGWLARGGVITTLYGAVLAVHLLGGLVGSAGVRQVVAVVGGPLAVATAVYTAYLFAQATARARSRMVRTLGHPRVPRSPVTGSDGTYLNERKVRCFSQILQILSRVYASWGSQRTC